MFFKKYKIVNIGCGSGVAPPDLSFYFISAFEVISSISVIALFSLHLTDVFASYIHATIKSIINKK